MRSSNSLRASSAVGERTWYPRSGDGQEVLVRQQDGRWLARVVSGKVPPPTQSTLSGEIALGGDKIRYRLSTLRGCWEAGSASPTSDTPAPQFVLVTALFSCPSVVVLTVCKHDALPRPGEQAPTSEILTITIDGPLVAVLVPVGRRPVGASERSSFRC